MNKKKNKGRIFWEILERIIGRILSVIGSGLAVSSKNNASTQQK